MRGKNTKVFLGFSEVANYYTNLLKGFRELGVDYTFMTYAENIRKYEGDVKTSFQQKLLHKLSSNLSKYRNNKILYPASFVLFYLMRVYLFVWAMLTHDVFIFSYNSSFLGLHDLPILKFFGKKLIFVYHGSDARPPYLSGNYIYEEYSPDRIYEIVRDLHRKNRLVNRHADHVVVQPPTGLFFDRSMINFVTIGLPIDLGNIEAGEQNGESDRIKIVHAPSVKKQKGSHIFAGIIEELKKEGYEIDYRELCNLPNRVVLEELAGCDFVLDELYSDTTMAGLATEAAFFGKPTVVGGYYRDIQKDLKSIPAPPSLYVEPEQIKEAIVKMIEDVSYREELGRKAREYVETYWTPREVASRFLKLIRDDVPEEWTFHPGEIDYFYGWGVAKEDLKAFLYRYISRFGSKGLFLDHNPKLRDRIVRFAMGENK